MAVGEGREVQSATKVHRYFVIYFHTDNGSFLPAVTSKLWTQDKGQQGPSIKHIQESAKSSQGYFSLKCRKLVGGALAMIVWQ